MDENREELDAAKAEGAASKKRGDAAIEEMARLSKIAQENVKADDDRRSADDGRRAADDVRRGADDDRRAADDARRKTFNPPPENPESE